jgi:hypothetical protein
MRHTEIARELDLSVWTIARIADKRRFQSDELSEDEPPEDGLPEDDAPPDYVAKNLRRCPGCGSMVYLWPCLACRMGTTTLPVASPGDAEGEAPEVEALRS